MHSSFGALSETLYVYAPALEMALKMKSPVHLLNVGFGLGYHEILAALVSLENPGRISEVVTYESEAELIEKYGAKNISTNILNQMLPLLAMKNHPTKDSLAAIAEGKWSEFFAWRFLGELPEALPPAEKKSTCIFYDLFSSAFASQYWEEAYLTQFLEIHAASECVFASYAHTGALKRALKANGFAFEKREGFGVKRECTLALRNIL